MRPYSPMTTFWKGARAALYVTVAGGLASLGDPEVLEFLQEHQWRALGGLFLAGAFESLRNWAKQTLILFNGW